MIARILLWLISVAPAATLAQPAPVCPWLSPGTASKILGSDVTFTAHTDSNWSGSCRFVTSAVPAASIEVVVGKTDTHPCGARGTPLTAIGNEAVLCSLQDPEGRDVQTVTGRVRNAWFVVVLVLLPPDNHAPQLRNEPEKSSAIEFLAEQIAGNLY